jgi:hypothetical protein
VEFSFHLSILLHGVQFLIRYYFTFLISHVTPGSFVAQVPQIQGIYIFICMWKSSQNTIYV